MNEGGEKQQKGGQNGMMSCGDIQSVLFDYMTRELGTARSDLVREHIRKCESCRAAAADIQATLDLLKKASASTGETMPSRLSRKRRKRIIRAMMHPVLDWISVNHFIVSVIVMGLVIIAALLILRTLEPWRISDPPEGITVTIGLEREDSVEELQEEPEAPGPEGP